MYFADNIAKFLSNEYHQWQKQIRRNKTLINAHYWNYLFLFSVYLLNRFRSSEEHLQELSLPQLQMLLERGRWQFYSDYALRSWVMLNFALNVEYT